MKVRPLGERVMIELVKEENKSGIVLPTDHIRHSEGIIVAVPKYWEEAYSSKGSLPVGTKVLISKYAGDDIEVDGKPFKMVEAQDLLAVLEE